MVRDVEEVRRAKVLVADELATAGLAGLLGLVIATDDLDPPVTVGG
jgi:hypothetical protein